MKMNITLQLSSVRALLQNTSNADSGTGLLVFRMLVKRIIALLTKKSLELLKMYKVKAMLSLVSTASTNL